MYPSFYSNSIEEQLSHPLLKRNRKRLFEQKKWVSRIIGKKKPCQFLEQFTQLEEENQTGKIIQK